MLTTDDRQQICETLARHAFVVDEDRLDRLGEVFTPDATYDLSSAGIGTFRGLDALRAAAAQMSAAGHAPLSHFVTNIVITESGAEDGTGTGTRATSASVRSKGLMIMNGGGVHGVVHDDTVVLLEDRWLIASRVVLALRTPAGDLH